MPHLPIPGASLMESIILDKLKAICFASMTEDDDDSSHEGWRSEAGENTRSEKLGKVKRRRRGDRRKGA